MSSILVDKKEILTSPVRWNFIRYTDNDRYLINLWENEYRLLESRPEILSFERTQNGYKAKGVIGANCIVPVLEFAVQYTLIKNKLDIEIEYKLDSRVKSFPRFGFEMLIPSKYDKFSFIGFGKTESYCDKVVACEYGLYSSTASENYEYNYIRPQESGSHYFSKYLSVDKLFSLTAEKEFSFSVNPYTTKQLYETKHNFELPKNDFVCVCVDLAMRGVGSFSCGPELPKEKEIPTTLKNKFTITF